MFRSKLLLVLMTTVASVVFFATDAFSEPYLLSSPNQTCREGCKVEIAGLPFDPLPEELFTMPDGSISIDLARLPVGEFNVDVRVCKLDIQNVCSQNIPFLLIKEEIQRGKKYHIIYEVIADYGQNPQRLLCGSAEMLWPVLFIRDQM